jgi:hypothetical protein
MGKVFEPKAGEHVLLKTVFGALVIGTLVAMDEKTITVSKPLEVVYRTMMGPQGQAAVSLGIIDYYPVAILGNINVKEEAIFRLEHLAHPPFEPAKGLVNNYIQASTGIQVAQTTPPPPGGQPTAGRIQISS